MLIGELLLEINYHKEKEGFTDKDKIKITNFKEDFDIQCVTTQSEEGLKNGEPNCIFLTFNQENGD